MHLEHRPTVFFFQAEDGIRAGHVTGVQTCALPISRAKPGASWARWTRSLGRSPRWGCPRPSTKLPGRSSRGSRVTRTRRRRPRWRKPPPSSSGSPDLRRADAMDEPWWAGSAPRHGRSLRSVACLQGACGYGSGIEKVEPTGQVDEDDRFVDGVVAIRVLYPVALADGAREARDFILALGGGDTPRAPIGARRV